MRKLLVFVILLSVFLVIYVKAEELNLSAHSAAIIDADTCRIIFEKNCNEKLSMASTTKIITAITALENGDLSDIVTVSENAAATEGSSVYLEAGEKLTLHELLYAMMLESGNDAAVAVAEHIGGSINGFADKMNALCLKVGANDTHLTNPSGLDEEEHYTTAADLARITAYAMQNETFRQIVSTTQKSIPWQNKEWDRQLSNHNKLLRLYDGADGVKTGFTKKSGRCLVSSAVRNGRRLIAVTLSAPDDWNDHRIMLDYAFNRFNERETVVKAGEVLGGIPVNGSKTKWVNYAAKEDYSVMRIPDSSPEIRISVPGVLFAPIQSEHKVGTAEIIFDGNVRKTIDLYTTQAATDDNLLYKFKNRYYLLLKALLNLMR